MSDYSWKEMMAVVFSREIQDTDKITSGAHTEIFFAATMLAQKTHAPNLKLQLGGSVTLCQVTDIDVPELPKTSTGYDLIRYAESVHDHPDPYLFYGAPGGKDYYKDGREYRDVNHFWFADKFFVGASNRQMGQHQRSGWPAKNGKMASAVPAPSASTILPSACVTPMCSSPLIKRRLVDKVDYIASRQKVCRDNGFTAWPEMDRDAGCLRLDPNTLEARLAKRSRVSPWTTSRPIRLRSEGRQEVESVRPPTKDELETTRESTDRRSPALTGERDRPRINDSNDKGAP